MAYKYDPPPSRTPAESRRAIDAELKRWKDMGVDIGARDFPPPKEIGSHTATVRFQRQGRPVEITCDTWGDYDINLRCCLLAIQSMRLNEARGIGETLQRAYGYLPAPETHKDPYEVLGVHSTMDLEDIEAVYRSKARRLGEGAPELRDLNIAMDRIRDEKSKEAP